MSRFANVPPAPAIEIFALKRAFLADQNPRKVDLGIGAYRDNTARPWVLPVVRKAESMIAADESLDHEYLDQLGLPQFRELATRMLLGADSAAISEGRAFGVQGLSGTGCLRIAADFFVRYGGFKVIYVSDPTWPNHNLIFKHAGFEDIRKHRYYEAATRGLDFKGFMEDLEAAPEGAVFTLHACAHNPTGVDPTQDQWKQIAEVMRRRKLFPLFDCAYQGFASGDLVKDSWAVRYFVEQGFELLCAQSFAKNFGLYNERAGNLTFVLSDKSAAENVRGQVTLLVRGNYSNPPAHGARIVATVLSNPQLYEEWSQCIVAMSSRIIEMRKALRTGIEGLATPGTWAHITSQIGMFSYTGLTEEQVAHLVNEWHIYLPKAGRISLSGINTNNVQYVAEAFHSAVTKFPAK